MFAPPGKGSQGAQGARGARTPEEAECSRIPIGPFRRSASLRLRGERSHRALAGRSLEASPVGPGGFPPFPAITEARESDASPPRGPPAQMNARQRSLSLSLAQSNQKYKAAKTPSKSPLSSTARTCLCSVPPRHGVAPPTPPGSPEEAEVDDDLDSLHSYSSVATTASCDHAYVARNGTTFSGRKMKYVVHCSAHAGQTGEEYLTPTQRAQRQIRRLKALLNQAKLDLEKKDSDIFRLTKEVVELRLYKASLVSPDEKSTSSDTAVTVKEITCDDVQTPDSPNVADLTDDGPLKSSMYKNDNFKNNQMPSCSYNLGDLHSSLTDSGHFEDLSNSSIHSKDSMGQNIQDKACSTDNLDREDERRKLIHIYEKKIEDITRRNSDETQEMKTMHNDRVEAILQKLADVNARYSEIMPDYEQAKERIRELEKRLEEVSKQLAEQEDKHHKMYLHMYTKGQQAAQFEHANQVMELTHTPQNRVSVPELLQELQITQRELDNLRAMYKRIVEAQAGSRRSVDPEVTLQFLKSAIYYFLTDRENHQGHLNAIESILGFSDKEKETIQRSRHT